MNERFKPSKESIQKSSMNEKQSTYTTGEIFEGDIDLLIDSQREQVLRGVGGVDAW